MRLKYDYAVIKNKKKIKYLMIYRSLKKSQSQHIYTTSI